MDPPEELGGLSGSGREVRPAKQKPGVGESCDRQAIPGGHNLVVARGPGAAGAGRKQLAPDAGEAVIVGRIGAQLQH